MTILTAILLTAITSGLLSYAAPDPIGIGAGGVGHPVEEEFTELDHVPEVIVRAKPDYPSEARKQGLEGDVWLKTFVNDQGQPSKIKVFRSSGSELLDQAALAAARKCEYKPAEVDGQPVGCWVRYKVRFLLQ